LGTSSAVPTLARNVTCNVLRFHSGRLWLVDCGEGTQMRFLQQGLVFERIDRIFITHLHGDHCYGLFGMLAMLKMKGGKRPILSTGEPQPIEVIGPRGLKAMIDAVYSYSQLDLNFPIKFYELDFDKDTPIVVNLPLDYKYRDDNTNNKIGWEIIAFPLIHSVPCFGYLFIERDLIGKFNAKKAIDMGVPKNKLSQLAKGNNVKVEIEKGKLIEIKTSDCMVEMDEEKRRKIIVLGDTCDSDSIFRYLQQKEANEKKETQIDLVVHEATYGKAMKKNAVKAGHSTTKMAARFAKKIKAKKLIITHFSCRYTQPWNDEKLPTIEDLLNEAKNECKDSCVKEVFAASDFWFLEIPPKY